MTKRKTTKEEKGQETPTKGRQVGVINLIDIRPYKGSQNEAFEEFVCQLVRRTDAANQTTWMRLYGAGGDGGVEAYWCPAPGKKVGVQAKFFSKSADVDWNQVTHSFETALAIHSDLTEYRIYLSCDLTGPTGRSGRSGDEAWKAALARMQSHAAQKGRQVEITLTTAGDILSELAKPRAVGLSELWFGGIEFPAERLRSLLDSTFTALGDRYHPEDHVEVGAQDVLRALSRSHLTKDNLFAGIDEALKRDWLRLPEEWEEDSSKRDAIKQINESIDALASIKAETNPHLSKAWPVGEWHTKAEAIQTALHALTRDTFSATDDKQDEKARNSFLHFRNEIHKLIGSLTPLVNLLASEALRAEASRAAVFVGPAGSGKSHLLAAAAREILTEGGMCIMLLGHQLHGDHLWSLITTQLGLPGKTRQQLLGALDSAAARTGRRALIIIDALNEGPLRPTWLSGLEPFANEVLACPCLALAVSCRDVFADHVISPNVKARFPVVRILGFETEEEQENAARVYLDGRGIARPSMPWLAPEFINPLFLRTCCNALKSQGIRTFPTGLHGTKQILAFYLDALARTLGTDWDGSTTLAAPCKSGLAAVARAMAANQRDWLERVAADQVLGTEFAGFTPPNGSSWLQVFLRNGVLREDPHPEGFTNSDPLSSKPDVIRFAFQRFQDHLMAGALLEAVTDSAAAFAPGGPLAFILSPSGQPAWEWSGLIEALSIQLPEKLSVEFVDALPGGAERHWGSYPIEQPFVQSIKWRDPKAISDRTLQLGNDLRNGPQDLLRILIELAPRADHPWNADLLDKNLRGWPLPKRDRNWTMPLSTEGMYEGHPIHWLIAWCETAAKDEVDGEVLRLCGITLTWSLSSTANVLRDRATKALASLFTDQPCLFPVLLEQFAEVDDLYVVERLLAAGYGSLVRWPTPDKARDFALAVWECFFARDHIPPNHLLLDYATGIVELANGLGALPNGVELAKCKPPFILEPPVLDVTKEQVEQIANLVGDEHLRILRSCGEYGDFGRYEIQPRLGDISTAKLANPMPPLNPRQTAFRFETEVIGLAVPRRNAIKHLERVCQAGLVTEIIENQANGTGFGFSVKVEDRSADPDWQTEFTSAEQALLTLLTPDEIERYEQEWRPTRHPTGRAGEPQTASEIETVSRLPASWWVAKRAYEFGWSAELFGTDIDSRSYGRERARVERIGKKYQWLARSELLARLVNNYWMIRRFSDGGVLQYAKITDLDFERDVEPTLFEAHRHVDGQKIGVDLGLLMPAPTIPELNEPSRLLWPFEEDASTLATNSHLVTDRTGKQWLRLLWHASFERPASVRRREFGHNFAQRQFSSVKAVLCRRGQGSKIADLVHAAGHIDLHEWSTPEWTDGPYVYEVTRRGTWPAVQWRSFERFQATQVFEISLPAEEYLWESHLDRSLVDGARGAVLAPWLMQAQNFELCPTSPQLFRNAAGDLVGWSPRSDDGDQSGIVVPADWFESYLAAQNLDCVWIVSGEREAWRDGDQEQAKAYRRFNGIKVFSNGEWRTTTWNEDHPATPSVDGNVGDFSPVRPDK